MQKKIMKVIGVLAVVLLLSMAMAVPRAGLDGFWLDGIVVVY